MIRENTNADHKYLTEVITELAGTASVLYLVYEPSQVFIRDTPYKSPMIEGVYAL